MLDNIHFSRKEFECECCNFDVMDYELILMLEDVRSHFTELYGKVKVVITGGNRCVAHNEEVQKKYVKNYVPFSSRSQHIFGKACDFKVYYLFNGKWLQIDPVVIYAHIDRTFSNCGLGLYHNRCHLDSRGVKARWDG